MCYEVYHHCKYCGRNYPCNLDNYMCPTINGDADRNMCDECRAKEKRDFKRHLEDYGQPSGTLSIEEWENK